jgi:HAD superfamily hydrolase (TIGR01459 family)
MLTNSPPRVDGIAGFVGRYDALVCDVWGVVHNGVEAFGPACDALVRWREAGGKVLLLTNAPRPSAPIHEQLAKLGVPREAYDDLLTSGDVTREILRRRTERRVLHVGPPRDLPLIDGLHMLRVGDADAEIVLVTGLFDDTVETPEDYRARLAVIAERRLPLVCANPDIVVERGHQRVWCAGALARLYEELGGEITLVGKPWGPVYDETRMRISELYGKPFGEVRTLAIGDGLATDVRGAFLQKIDTLFVTGGIHAADFGPIDEPDAARVSARLEAEKLGATAFVPRLRW